MGAPAGLPYAPDAALDVLELVGGCNLERIEAADAVVAAKEAARIGQKEAADWAGLSLEAELARMGVELRRLGGAPGGEGAGVRVAALTTYDSRPAGTRRVDLYLGEIARKHRALLGAGAEVAPDELVELHLAHEFYHVLEFSSGRRTERLVPAMRVRGLLGARPRPARRSSEVAAHAFARAWLGRGPHPALVDALVLVASGALTAEELRRRTAWALNLLDTYQTCD